MASLPTTAFIPLTHFSYKINKVSDRLDILLDNKHVDSPKYTFPYSFFYLPDRMEAIVGGMDMNKRKIFKAIGIVVLALVAVYIFLLLALGHILHPEFYKSSHTIETIPGLSEDFVPQGVTITDDGAILICGYSSSDKPSRIYSIVDGKESMVYLENEDGTVYKGHAGGITSSGEYVYISNASKIFILRLNDVLSTSNGDTLSFIGHFSVPCRSSFCSSDGKYLYVGEYYAPGYDTDESHRLTTTDGKAHNAITFAFPLDKDGKAGTEPVMAFSTSDKVQGFATFNGKVALSISAGLKESTILFYDGSGVDSSFSYNGVDIPLIILDSNRLIKKLDAPHMSEDLEYRNGILAVAFESGAKKYGMGFVPSSERNIKGMEIEKLLP